MRILKFEGDTMREAIAKVKAELGDAAVIVATREVRRGLLGTGFEISAAVDDDGRAGGPNRSGPAPAPGLRSPDLDKLIDPLRSELRSLRAIVRASGENRSNAELRSEVAELRKLVEQMRQHKAPAASAEVPLVAPSTGRAIMLVGPTGAGKTTTIAKLAARAALVEGRRVKLATLDNFRIGGVDQIRTYADLIGVPLEVLDHPSQLAALLADETTLTLIDTAGRSPRDVAPIDELAAAVAHAPPIEVHLVTPAATSMTALDALVARYRGLSPSHLLVTKLDEVDACPELATMPARTGLPITWITMGQAVPEDLEEPSAARVLELASSPLHQPGPRGHRAA